MFQSTKVKQHNILPVKNFFKEIKAVKISWSNEKWEKVFSFDGLIIKLLRELVLGLMPIQKEISAYFQGKSIMKSNQAANLCSTI